jgi:putative transposase
VKSGRELSVVEMCTVASFSRAGYYRSMQAASPVSAEDAQLLGALSEIAEQWPSYGSRRIAEELRAQGFTVSRKRTQRLMRENNLLCAVKRKFAITTDSAHPLKVYPNLAGSMAVTGINQLWVADITYIRLEDEFVYLAVVPDACSRRVIGWSLDDTMSDSLSIAALRMALAGRTIQTGLVHHSDRGVQYASHDYAQLLRENGITISMSRKANPWDNAKCESFMKTLKHEEVHRTEYRNLADARTRIGRFLESIYNEKRLHSALHYMAPNQFEGSLTAATPTGIAA